MEKSGEVKGSKKYLAKDYSKEMEESSRRVSGALYAVKQCEAELKAAKKVLKRAQDEHMAIMQEELNLPL